MSPHSLRQLLAGARQRQFVGRERERDLLAAALAADTWPFAMLHVSGLGGMGKTTLLRLFEDLASAKHVPGLEIQGRDVHPTVDGFRLALAAAAREADITDLDARMRGAGGRWFIALDDGHLLSPLEDWLRTTWLPSLPSSCLVVRVCRQPASVEWHRHGGWHGILQQIRLEALTEAEVGEYLTRRRLDAELRSRVVELTAGHPLMMAMLADAMVHHGAETFSEASLANIYRNVAAMLVDDVRDSGQRRALELCVIACDTTEALLSEAIGGDAHDVFDWLAGQSWVEIGSTGLHPHDVARLPLAAALRWRNPIGYEQAVRTLASSFIARLTAGGAIADQDIEGLLFLLEDPAGACDARLQGPPTQFVPAAAADRSAIVAMTCDHEGAAAAGIVQAWFDLRPEAFAVLRRRDAGQVEGYHLALMLDAVDLARPPVDDPAVTVLAGHVASHRPLAEGDRVYLNRAWMSRTRYKKPSRVASAVRARSLRLVLGSPRLAACAAVDDSTRGGKSRPLGLPLPQFAVGGAALSLHFYDLRTRSVAEWLSAFAGGVPPIVAATVDAAPVVPSHTRTEFDRHVRAALRDHLSPSRIGTNPLLLSRMVQIRCQPGNDSAVAVLRDMVRQAVEALAGSPRTAKLHRALVATYLQGAENQEIAAEGLDLPLSTYRRHLLLGVAEVASILWLREQSS